VAAASDEGHRRRSWDQFGEFAKVLGDCGEMELITGAAGDAQSQAVIITPNCRGIFDRSMRM
jgi:hypothetical protein